MEKPHCSSYGGNKTTTVVFEMISYIVKVVFSTGPLEVVSENMSTL